MQGSEVTRRGFLIAVGGFGLGGLIASAVRAEAAPSVELPFENGRRELVSDFPQKGTMILQRTRPPLLETPFEVFDQGVFTPNDRFFVRWHLADVPTTVNPAEYRMKIHGQVGQPLELSLDELVRDFTPLEIAAVNQCSGNSRAFFSPRVPGGQWGNGAMGNALWRGVSLKQVLDRAGVGAGARQVRFRGLDAGTLPQTPAFIKALDIDHARDGEVMIAYAMNGQPLPLLNGFPLRLVVPGWYSTYWVKMLNDIEVLDSADENYWMKKAYLIPNTPFADIAPGQQGVTMVPINRMVPRSFFTSVREGSKLPMGAATTLRGIAFGGDSAIAKVLFSPDAGSHWQEARLGPDHGKYSFRQWQVSFRPQQQGAQRLMIRAVNTAGVSQPDRPNWNGGGYMRNVVESISIQAV